MCAKQVQKWAVGEPRRRRSRAECTSRQLLATSLTRPRPSTERIRLSPGKGPCTTCRKSPFAADSGSLMPSPPAYPGPQVVTLGGRSWAPLWVACHSVERTFWCTSCGSRGPVQQLQIKNIAMVISKKICCKCVSTIVIAVTQNYCNSYWQKWLYMRKCKSYCNN